MNKDELLEISKNFFGSVFQVENVSEKIRNLTYREVKKVFSAHDPRDLDCIVYPYEVLFTRNSRHLILTTRVLVLCTVLLYSTHSLQFVFTRSVLYCGWTLHFKLRIYFVHLFYRLRGQQVFRKYLNNLILEY